MTESNNQSPSKKVLVITASVGAGHNSAARAIVAALKEESPQVEVKCIDVLDYTPRIFRAVYRGGYVLAVTKFPKLYGLGFWLQNRPQTPHRKLSERRRLWLERKCLRRLGEYVTKAQPDLIINTHFLSVPFVGSLIEKGQLKARQAVVVTDIEVHRWWHSENVDKWYVPTQFSFDVISSWGIDKNKMTVSGIPVHPKFSEPLDRSELLGKWRLPTDKKIFLLSGGTEFTCGPVTKVAQQILQKTTDTCLVVLCGRNKKLLGEVSKLAQPETFQGRLFPVAFTDRVNELMEISSMMVTKPGGATVAECLSKGLPMLATRPVPGQESGNARYLAEKGAALVIPKFSEVPSAVCELLADQQKLDQMATNARNLHKDGATIISESLCRDFLS